MRLRGTFAPDSTTKSPAAGGVGGRKASVFSSAPEAQNAAAAASESSASGHWHIVTDTGQGTEEAELEIEVAADGSVTGTVSSHMGTATITSGHLSGNSLTFGFSMDVGEGPSPISAQGTIDGQHMTGTISVAGMNLPFTATKPRTLESGDSSAEVGR